MKLLIFMQNTYYGFLQKKNNVIQLHFKGDNMTTVYSLYYDVGLHVVCEVSQTVLLLQHLH